MNKLRLFCLMSLIMLMSVINLSAQDGETLTVRLSQSGISTLDPVFMGDTASEQAFRSMTVGLTRIDPETAEIVSGLATRWSRTVLPNDTAVYRFDIRDDIPWVRYDADQQAVVQIMDDNGNPRMVTEQDIVYGILRSISPDFGGETSYALAEGIAGGLDYLTGTVDADGVALNINLDDFSITTTGLDVDLLLLLTTVQAFPQPSWLIEDVGFDWTLPENFVSYGPYVLQSWSPDVEMTLVANPFWATLDGVPRPSIEVINFVFMPDEEAFPAYGADEINVMLGLSNDALSTVYADTVFSADLMQYPLAIPQFYGLNLRDNMPTASTVFRQALAHAVNRDALLDIIQSAGYLPANRYLPESIIGLPDGLEANVLQYDLGLAQEQLSVAVSQLDYASVDDLPAIDLIYLNTDYYKTLATAIADTWTTELGLTVTLLPQDYEGSLFNREYAAVWQGDWSIDFPAVGDVYQPFSADGELREALGWDGTAFDDLLANLAMASDEERAGIISGLEEILIEDAIIIPISWAASNELTKPYVLRTPSINGINAFETWRVVN